jgi:uncharacterized protein (DUF58 family)
VTTPAVDEAAVERAAAGRALALPRGPQRGRVGDVRSNSVGSALELHDFRHYQPGDDVRHLDWNAVARTGELVLRVRQDEVSPRVEVVVDATASMAVTPEKSARAREVAMLFCSVAQRAGLEAVLITVGQTPRRAVGHEARAALRTLEQVGRESFVEALGRAPPLRPCGVRVLVSDLLFEAAPEPLVRRLARGATALFVAQVLDAEDLAPTGGAGARLTDSESGEVLERVLTEDVLRRYRDRLEAHQRLWAQAVLGVQGRLGTGSAEHAIDRLAGSSFAAFWEAA